MIQAATLIEYLLSLGKYTDLELSILINSTTVMLGKLIHGHASSWILISLMDLFDNGMANKWMFNRCMQRRILLLTQMNGRVDNCTEWIDVKWIGVEINGCMAKPNECRGQQMSLAVIIKNYLNFD